MQNKKLVISNKPEISAIYFALLQCGYDYYALEKKPELVSKLESFREEQTSSHLSFFTEIRQNSCEVYPYWPRAAVLEEATFYLDENVTEFVEFDQFQKRIMTAGNIAPNEKENDLWDWISQFPAALNDILNSVSFQAYFAWEETWIATQNQLYLSEIENLQRILQKCDTQYCSPVQKVHILLNPIKCAYSSDYYMYNGNLYFSSGWFRMESILHEFLHPVIHPYVLRNKEEILKHSGSFPDIDESYLLDGSDAGRLNAAEEYFVRALTERAVYGVLPNDLNQFVQDKLHRR